MYALVVTNKGDEAKAERIIQRFTRRAQVKKKHSIMFLYSERPVDPIICMHCRQEKGECPLGISKCPVDRAIEQTLLGAAALQYIHVKAKLVFPAP